MAWWNRREIPPAPGLGEPCDRCPKNAAVRVAKTVPVVSEVDGIPDAVDEQQMQLTFCTYDFAVFEEPLRQRYWQVLDDKRA